MARALAHQPPLCQPFPLLRKQKAAAAQGPANWHNRTLWTGNNLDILRGMNAASVDLLYTDISEKDKAKRARSVMARVVHICYSYAHAGDWTSRGRGPGTRKYMGRF